jgi:hypothetical protein
LTTYFEFKGRLISLLTRYKLKVSSEVEKVKFEKLTAIENQVSKIDAVVLSITEGAEIQFMG